MGRSSTETWRSEIRSKWLIFVFLNSCVQFVMISGAIFIALDFSLQPDRKRPRSRCDEVPAALKAFP
jgi:hypothetical protein